MVIRALNDCEYNGNSSSGVRFHETDQLYSRMKGIYRMGTAHSMLYLHLAAWPPHTDKSIIPNYHVGIRGRTCARNCVEGHT